MKICGIVTEYNPFHNGHLRQIEYIKEQLPDAVIVALMSGNFVQRGEPAVIPKHKRAEIAVECGVNAVLELPYPYCCSSAGYFGFGAVNILDCLGVDYICFGSEVGDIHELQSCAKRLLSPEFLSEFEKRKQEGSYIEVSRIVYKKLFGKDIPDGPNNTLAIEYLKNLILLNSRITPITHRRIGSSSATESRRRYRNEPELLPETVPEFAYNVYKDLSPVDMGGLSGILLWHLRTAEAEELCRCGDIDMGLASRMKSVAAEAKDIYEFFSFMGTKKYTDSRIRRAALNTLLGVTETQLKTPPTFTTLLAVDSLGCTALKQMKKNKKISIITKLADHEEVKGEFGFSHKADILYSTLTGEPSSLIMKRSPKIFLQN